MMKLTPGDNVPDFKKYRPANDKTGEYEFDYEVIHCDNTLQRRQIASVLREAGAQQNCGVKTEIVGEDRLSLYISRTW